MKPITTETILPLGAYLQVREQMRRDIIEHKKNRRIEVGPQVTFVFEDRKTTLFQVQEILRCEEITDPEAIASELAIYNGILPDDGQLSATVMIAFSSTADIRAERKKLVGMMENVRLRFGDHALPARFEEGRETEERISAVQYISFEFDAAAIEAFGAADEVVLAIEHPGYEHQTVLWQGMKDSLLGDLS
ncbi:MAG: DUF3501 family protein [Deltaproteobacteria bacterium]|nr:DUF3501 family protein [Deltaproteobacteria bacterium]